VSAQHADTLGPAFSPALAAVSQVPLHIGTALSAAAQHDWTSPGMHAALSLLDFLLNTAAASGLIKHNTTAGSLTISMRQQLQDSGVLRQVTGVMAALAEDMRVEAAAVDSMHWDEKRAVASNVIHSGAHCVRFEVVAHVYPCLMALWFMTGETPEANNITWLCDPSCRHAEAAMHLCTAALQHTSSMLQHVLPAVQQQAPQRAAVLLRALQDRAAAALDLGHDVAVPLSQAGHATAPLALQQQLVQLQLVSEDCLPFVASLVSLYAFRVMAYSQQGSRGRLRQGGSSPGCSSSSTGNSTTTSSGSSRRGRDSGSSSMQQGQPGATASSSSVMADGDITPTPCQLQLCGILGIVPQLAVSRRTEQARSLVLHQLSTALAAYAACFNALQKYVGLIDGQFKQQLWLLLPSVLLPCASKLLLLPAASTRTDPIPLEQQQSTAVGVLDYLLNLSWSAAAAHSNHVFLGGSPIDGGSVATAREVLEGVLQLADQLLLQQQHTKAALQGQAAAAGAGAAVAAGGNRRKGSTVAAPAGSSASKCQLLIHQNAETGVKQTEYLVRLLAASLTCLHLSTPANSSTSSSSTASPLGKVSSCDTAAAVSVAAAATAVPSAPVFGERFVDVCTAMEAGLRAATTAIQVQSDHKALQLIDPCLRGLCLGFENDIVDSSRSLLLLHLGLRGPEALVLEQRQYYSTLSTVQKLGRAAAIWGQRAANHCCMAIAHAAVGLLQPSLPQVEGSGAARAGAAAGQQVGSLSEDVLQLPEVEHLPSLVLLGRCCLVWAEQLHHQSPELLLQVSVATVPEQQQQQEGEQAPLVQNHCAAHVCIPEWWVGRPGWKAPPSGGLERWVAVVFSWVDSIRSHAAQAALAAAAGGDLQQFRQQLEALSAAQQAVRQEGVSEDALAALVEQMHATGVMLSSVAVPHFCNNPGCVNLTGPTEVQLVSGRSCICAGCRVARYCGAGCQRQAWRKHKPVCKTLAAAAEV
jgi:hypothetical protein